MELLLFLNIVSRRWLNTCRRQGHCKLLLQGCCHVDFLSRIFSRRQESSLGFHPPVREADAAAAVNGNTDSNGKTRIANSRKLRSDEKRISIKESESEK